MEWYYNGHEVKDEELDSYKSFVYKITNLLNGRIYYGKKRLFFINRKKVKGRKNRVIIQRQSDWKNYYGSNEELKSDVVQFGEHNFKREILRLCKSLSEANYHELKVQMDHEVLFYPRLFYNSYLGTRVSRKQLGIKND